MSALRRYEILLPSQFNDGRPVPPDLIADTLQELEQAFGAVSCETQTIQGLWHHEGELYRDSLARVFINVQDRREPAVFRPAQGPPQEPVSAEGYLADDLPD